MGPTFICVGMAKCGTTTLHNYFAQHPEVSVPENKERAFFTRLEEGRMTQEEYEAGWVDDLPIRGECDPNHAYYAKTIRSMYPDTKIIVIVRDPIERMISHVGNNVRRVTKGDFAYDWRNMLENIRAGIIKLPSHDMSQYKRIIQPYRRMDHRVFKFEDMLADQNAFFASVCEYVGAAPFEVEPIHSLPAVNRAEPLDDEMMDAYRELFRDSNDWLAERYGIRY